MQLYFKILDTESFPKCLFKFTVLEMHDAGNDVGNCAENGVRNGVRNSGDGDGMLMEMQSTQGMHGMQSYDRVIELLMIKDVQVPTLGTYQN